MTCLRKRKTVTKLIQERFWNHFLQIRPLFDNQEPGLGWWTGPEVRAKGTHWSWRCEGLRRGGLFTKHDARELSNQPIVKMEHQRSVWVKQRDTNNTTFNWIQHTGSWMLNLIKLNNYWEADGWLGIFWCSRIISQFYTLYNAWAVFLNQVPK